MIFCQDCSATFSPETFQLLEKRGPGVGFCPNTLCSGSVISAPDMTAPLILLLNEYGFIVGSAFPGNLDSMETPYMAFIDEEEWLADQKLPDGWTVEVENSGMTPPGHTQPLKRTSLTYKKNKARDLRVSLVPSDAMSKMSEIFHAWQSLYSFFHAVLAEKFPDGRGFDGDECDGDCENCDHCPEDMKDFDGDPDDLDDEEGDDGKTPSHDNGV